MKILITGATGFIGRNLAMRLIGDGHEVVCAGRSFGKINFLLDKAKTAFIDLNKKESIAETLDREKPEVIYHCAALVESVSLGRLFKVNAEGTGNLLEACFKRNINKVIYLSSIAVVSGNDDVPLTSELPYKATSAYGRSKLEAEKIAIDYRKKGMKIAILRPPMVYGECEPHALSSLVSALKKRLLPVFGKGDKKLHLVSVENLVDVMVLCLSRKEAYEGTYFVADKEVLDVKQIMDYVADTIGAKRPVVLPGFIATMFGKIPIIKRWLSLYLKDRIYDIKPLREKLGYVPRVSIYDGLKRAVASCERRT